MPSTIKFKGANTVAVYNVTTDSWSNVEPNVDIVYTGTIIATAEKAD